MTDEFFREQRRALIEKARSNSFTQELRDGKVLTVLHLAQQFGLPHPWADAGRGGRLMP